MKPKNTIRKIIIPALMFSPVVIALLFLGAKSVRMSNISSQLSKADGFELVFTSEECYNELDQELIISTKGNFKYERIRFIEYIEEVHDQIPEETLTQVLYDIIYKHGFFELDEDLYNGDVSDGSTVFLYIKIGNKEKRIGGYGSTFENHDFREMINEIKELLKPYYSN
ncbi:MAG: hypothetical protein JEZ08_05140 [Clostridiales bacterium]|nr:hypothetical protein [Clostridiales bacterium]